MAQWFKASLLYPEKRRSRVQLTVWAIFGNFCCGDVPNFSHTAYPSVTLYPEKVEIPCSTRGLGKFSVLWTSCGL